MPKVKEAIHTPDTLANLAGILTDLAAEVTRRAEQIKTLGITEVPVKAGTSEAIGAKDRVFVFLSYFDRAVQELRNGRSDFGNFKADAKTRKARGRKKPASVKLSEST